MKTIEVELHLMKHFDFRQNIIVPNVTYKSKLVRFETDLLILSKSNYAHGIEIKVSLSDFKKDFEKEHIKQTNMESYYFKPLRYFSYAFPKKLLPFALRNVDERFGLYSLCKHENDFGKWVSVDEFRKPKTLFFKKWSDDQKIRLMHLGCMRVYNFKRKELRR